MSKTAPFRAEISNAQIVVFTLKGISTGKKDQHCYCEISADGLKFIATDASIAAQGTATISENVFDSWTLQLDPTVSVLSFRINLSILLQCLSCLGTSNLQHTDLKMAYFDEEECFSMQLMEGEVLTECKIRTIAETMDEDEGSRGSDEDDDEDAGPMSKVDFSSAFRNSRVVNKGIVKSDLLKEAFFELGELPGAATVNVLMSPSAPFFQLSADGQATSCRIDFPHGDETFAQLTCEKTMNCEYSLGLLQQAGKALGFSDKTFLRMNNEGTLSVQHMILQPDGKKTYVDYYILADVDDDDDDSEEDENQADA